MDERAPRATAGSARKEGGAGCPAVDPRAPVREQPAALAGDEAVAVASPVVGTALGDDEEVGDGGGRRRARELDRHVRDVMADERPACRGGEARAGVEKESPDGGPALRRRLVACLEGA